MIKLEYLLISSILSLSMACYGQANSLQNLDYLLLKDGRIIECDIINLNGNKIHLELYDINLLWEFGNEIRLFFIKAIITSKENIKNSSSQQGIKLCNNMEELIYFSHTMEESIYLSRKNIYYTIEGGISKLTGDGSEYWNTGFNVGLEFFKNISENVFIVGRIAYNRWSPNEDELKDEFSGIFSGHNLDFSGSASIIELIPIIRFVPSSVQEQKTQFFGQVGAGYYILEAEASASYRGNYSNVSIDNSDSKLGINFGAGIIIGSSGKIKFSVYPMYNIIFTEEESTKYFTFNLGILFGN